MRSDTVDAMHWLVFYDVVDDYLGRREEFRPEHLRHVGQAHERGLLVMGGAYADPADGAAIVFKTEDRGEIEHWIEDDPYVRNGLVTEWRIRSWNVGVGAP